MNDIVGHQTYLAIRSGASGVLNLRLPIEGQIDALFATYTKPDPEERPSEIPAITKTGSGGLNGTDGDETTRLVQMLCSTTSISTIAQQMYTSERSMYRRLRQLYERVGVSGRSELRSVVSGGVDIQRP